MTRAYICLARNDLDENLLQDLDLLPYTSQRSNPYDGPGQTGYLTWFPQNDAITTTDIGGGVFAADADFYGLAAYIMDTVEHTTGPNTRILDPDATLIALAILARVGQGLTLTVADVNAEIVVVLGAGNGLGVGASFGTLEEILAIISGVSYKVPAGALMSGAANAFLPAVPPPAPFPGSGFFTTAPNLAEALLHPGGRKGTEPVGSARPTPQTPPEDAGHRFIRRTEDTSDLHRSALDGRFELMAAATYAFANPNFTYGAAGTALTVGGANIGIDHAARAVTVYAFDGTVII